MNLNYRSLTPDEVNALLMQGCMADDWSAITVKDGFKTDPIRDTVFSGTVKLGLFGEKTEVMKDLFMPSGLYNCHIHQCDIGDAAYVSHTGMISNYVIDDHVVVLNTASVTVSGETTFGNGTGIEIMNEAGGRELIIFDHLTAQIAYLLVFYRHDPEFTAKLRTLIQAYIAPMKAVRGRIGSFTKIRHAGVLHNVNIGNHAVISGSQLIEECTLASNPLAPVTIGEGVILKKSIVLSGSAITDGAFADKCFIGQGVSIGRQFSAENSAFFANTEVALGEACSVFAGPYTVSHHKSTLLVAGLFSFYNAGSGTNISNHMYKLGPLHQGIVERGSKTGSSSYLLWPSRIGAYSVVVGKHLTSFNTSDFPFSYIVDEKGKSILYPAMNLFTVGTRRDSEKWPARDKRKDPEKYDLISFEWLNPYIGNKIVNAIRLLEEFAEKAQKTQEYVSHKGIQIPRLLLKTTRKFYELALKVYTGTAMISRLEANSNEFSLDGIRELMSAGEDQGPGEWCDLSGMIAPAALVDKLTGEIRDGNCNTVEQVLDQLKDIQLRYKAYSWSWCSAKLAEDAGISPDQFTRETLIQIITDWKNSALKLNQMILLDASKEFDPASHYGYGIDGDESVNALDFEAVRGTYAGNKFVRDIRAENENIEKRCNRMIAMLQSL